MTEASPRRVHLSRAKGWRMPANTVRVARPSKWGNPFVAGRDGTRTECVALYRDLVEHHLATPRKAARNQDKAASLDSQVEARRAVLCDLAELRGKNLACWCPPPAPGEPDLCHAAVLLDLANREGEV